MSTPARVYVFICGWSQYLGLSLTKDGGNLPACLAPPHKWTCIDDVPFAADAVAALNIDATTAMENLKSRGYHVVRPNAEIVEFPLAGKARC